MKTNLLSLLLCISLNLMSYGQTEDFEDETDNTTSFTETVSGATFSVTGDFEIQKGGAFGAGGSNGWMDTKAAGSPTTGSAGQIQVSGSTVSFQITGMAAWTSADDATSEASGNITFRGTPIGGGAALVETIFIDPPNISTYDAVTFSGALSGANITALEVDLTGSGLNYIGLDNLAFTGIVLPVELVSFKVSGYEGKAHLRWQTASESNNSGFEIQRSPDGSTWKSLDFVKGNGTSVEENHYEYIDEEPHGQTSYYRLKQIDFDGAYEYTNVLSIIFSTDSQFWLTPNPAKDFVQIILPEAKANAQIRIFNSSGKLVKSELYSDNIKLYHLSIFDLPSGTYFVSFISENRKMLSKRFVKF